MLGTEPKRPWYRPTPDRFLVGLLMAQGGLLLADRFFLFGLSRGDLWNVQLAAGLVCGVVLVGLLWLVVGLLLRRRCQFGIRSMLLLTVAVAIPGSWYAVWIRNGQRQAAALADVRETHSRIFGGRPHRQIRNGSEAVTTRPSPRDVIVGISFAVEEDLGCGCCYGNAACDVSDDELGRLARFYRLERLEVPDAEITDAGLAHLSGLKNLRYLDLSGNPITHAGLAHLRGLRKLEHLDLSRTGITDAGFVHLGALENLQRLDFGFTAATGAEVKRLAACKAFKQCGGGSRSHALLSAEGACAFNELKGLEELHGLVARPASRGSSGESLEFDGHPKLRVIALENGLHLESVRLSNLPALEQARLGVGLCIHRVPWPGARELNWKPRTCTACSPDVETLQLENLPSLESLTVVNAHHLSLHNVPKLTAVGLCGVVEEEHIREIGRLSQLRILGVQVERFSNPDLFSELGRLPHLEELSISGEGLTDASLAILEGFPALKRLSLPSAGFSGHGLTHLGHLKSLEHLALGRFRDSGQPLFRLNELRCMKYISLLGAEMDTLKLVDMPNLDSINLWCPEIGMLKLADMPNLERLSINGGRVGTLELANLPRLADLRMQNGPAVRRLSVKNLASLRHLSLDEPAADRPLEHVELEQLPALTHLRLPGNWRKPLLTDDCFEHVGTFVSLSSLEIRNSLITDRTIERLTGLPRLRRVDMHNTHTTEAAANRLREAGPAGIHVNQSGPR